MTDWRFQNRFLPPIWRETVIPAQRRWGRLPP